MADGRSYTTSFNANTSGFKKGMDEMVKKLNEYNKELVNNQYRQRDANKAISDAKKKLKELNKETGDGKNANEDQKKQMADLTRTIEEETLKLSELKTEQASIRNLISQTTKTLTENNSSWTVLKGTLANLTSDTLKKLGSSLKNIVSDVIRTGESFSTSMSEVGAISGATAEDLQQMEEAARLYGATTRYSATEAADALKYMALAGWNAQQSIEGLPAVLNLAAASGMDLGQASDIVTDYITAFGLSVDDAARFVDIMSYAMSNSNTTTEMLGAAYKNCAATAHSMGFSVEEVTAALMTMANAGVKGGEAGTTLNTLMTRLATDTKGCATQLKEFGVEIYDSQGRMKSLSDIMAQLSSAWDSFGNDMQKQAELAKAIAGTNQYAGFQTLIQGMSKAAKEAGMSFEDYTAALEQCDGAAQSMAKTMSNNLSGDMKAMQSALDELELKIFDDAEQPLRNIVQWITKSGIPALEALVKNIDKIIPVVVAATAAMLSYKAALAVQSIIKGVQQGLAALRVARAADTAATEAETAAQHGLNAAQAANPIGLLVGLVGGLAAGLGSLAIVTNSAANATKNYNEELDQLLKKQSEAEASAVAEGKEVELLNDEYNRLREKTDLTTREKERLSTVCEQLAGKLGITTEELKTQEGAYRDLTGEVEKYIKKLKEQAKYDYYKDIITESAKSAEQIKADLEVAEKARDALLKNNITAYDEYIRILNSQGHNLFPSVNRKEIDMLITSLNQQLADAEKAGENAEEAYRKLGEGADDAADKTGVLTGALDIATAALKGVNDALEDDTDASKKLSDELSDLQKQGNSLRSEMNSLANSMKQLESGEALSLSALLDLIDKYPEYASELLAASGNADLQRQALEKLFEAKKQDYILTQQATIDNIKASRDETSARLENIQKQINAYQALGSVIGAVMTAQLSAQLRNYDELIAAYEKKIDFIRSISIDDLSSSGSRSGSSRSSGGSVSSAGKNSRTVTYTSRFKGEVFRSDYSYEDGAFDAVKAADAQAKATLGVLDRVKNLGKLTLNEEIHNLQELLKREQISDDMRYDLRLRLYKAQEQLAKDSADKQKELADKAAKAQEEAEKRLLERQNLALAAYNRLVNGKIEQYEAETKAAQDKADKEIAAIDAVMKKRQQEQDDLKRQKELDQINARLQYQQMDEFARLELERRRQDILNEQADIRFERSMENKKIMYTAGAEGISNRNAKAIAGLQASQTQFADRMAYLQGNQTFDQRVKNNSITQNLTVIQNGMSDDQAIKRLADKIKRDLGA